MTPSNETKSLEQYEAPENNIIQTSNKLFDEAYSLPAAPKELKTACEFLEHLVIEPISKLLQSQSSSPEKKTNEGGENKNSEAGDKKPAAKELSAGDKLLQTPEAQRFLTDLEKATRTGNIDQHFIDSAKELGKKCNENPALYNAMYLKLQGQGINLSHSKDAITFSRTTAKSAAANNKPNELTTNSDQTETILTVPLGKGEIGGSQVHRVIGGPEYRENVIGDKNSRNSLTKKDITPAEAAAGVFHPPAEPEAARPSPFEMPSPDKHAPSDKPLQGTPSDWRTFKKLLDELKQPKP
jgi:hypothetical protein